MTVKLNNYWSKRADGTLAPMGGSSTMRSGTLQDVNNTFHVRVSETTIRAYAGNLTGPDGTVLSYEWDAPGSGSNNKFFQAGAEAILSYSSSDIAQTREVSLIVTDKSRNRRKFTRTLYTSPVGKDGNKTHIVGKGNETVSFSITFRPQFTGQAVVQWQQVGGPSVDETGEVQTINVSTGVVATSNFSFNASAVSERTTWAFTPVLYLGNDAYALSTTWHSYTAVPTVASAASQIVNMPYPAWATADVRSAPLASSSDFAGAPTQAQMQTYIQSEINATGGNGIALNSSQYTASCFKVDANTPRYRVEWHDRLNYGYTPSEVYGGQKYFLDVPIPDETIQAVGMDGHVMFFDPVADKVWEFWQFWFDRYNRPLASHGGRIDNYSTSNAQFVAPWGVTASGLSWAAIMITTEEIVAAYNQIKSGGTHQNTIKHKIYMATVAPRLAAMSWPATRTDGYNTNNAAPCEGQTLRIDPTLDLTTLGLKPVALAIADACQRYGVIVADQAGTINLGCQAGLPEKFRTGTDPWTTVLEGASQWSLFKNIPPTAWQIVKRDWLKP